MRANSTSWPTALPESVDAEILRTVADLTLDRPSGDGPHMS